MTKIMIEARLIENVKSVVGNSRVHAIICDLPSEAGGTNKGHTALELALMALADCAVTVFAIIAKNCKIELTSLEAAVEAEKTPDSPKLSNVKVKAKVASKTREGLLKTVWRKTEEACPAFSIFKEPLSVETSFETEPVAK